MTTGAALILLTGTALAGALPNLTGTWARLTTTTARSQVPVIGDVQSVTTGIALVRIVQTGSSFTATEEICAVDNRTLGGVVKTSFGPGFRQALSGNVKRGHLVSRGKKVRYVEDWQFRVLGAAIDSPEEALPERADDPRVRDDDLDGQPGVSVTVGGIVSGEVFVVQKNRDRMQGTMLSPKVIVGHIEWTSEQRVIGATSDRLNTSPSATPDPDPAKNFFRMRRVPKSATCAELLALRKKFLGDHR